MSRDTSIPGLPVELPSRFQSSIRAAAASLPKSAIIEVVNYGRERPGLIPFWVGEGDMTTPEFICDAAVKSLREGATFYTYQRGIPSLRNAVSRYYKRHANLDIESERIVITNGGMQAMMESLQTVAGAGDEVIVVSPVWPNIYACVHMQEAIARSVPLQVVDGRWQLDLDQLFDAINDKTRAIYINTPNNPTGWVMDKQDMIRVRDVARERGLWIVADEVYHQFVYGGGLAPSFLEVMEPDERLLVTKTFSKNWAMTGWRCGWAVIPQALGQVFENLVQYNTSGVPEFLQQGCVTAVNEGDKFIEEQVARCRQGRDYVCDALLQTGSVELVKPQGAFYVFFKVKGETDSVSLAKRLVDEANVGFAPGTAFGPGGESYVRMCFASSMQTLTTGIERIAAALE